MPVTVFNTPEIHSSPQVTLWFTNVLKVAKLRRAGGKVGGELSESITYEWCSMPLGVFPNQLNLFSSRPATNTSSSLPPSPLPRLSCSFYWFSIPIPPSAWGSSGPVTQTLTVSPPPPVHSAVCCRRRRHQRNVNHRAGCVLNSTRGQQWLSLQPAG